MHGDAGNLRVRLLVGFWLALCLSLFLMRGVIPAFEYGKDGLLIYTEARAWLEGVSPYDAAGLDEVASRAKGDPDWPPTRRGNSDLLYPPTTFVVLSPIAAFDWPVASVVWIGFNVGLVGVIAWSLCTLAGLRHRDAAAWLLVGACMAFAPVLTSIKHGQTAVLVFALAAAGEALRVRGAGRSGGVLLGLAACVKPQIGLPLLALEGWRRRWRVLIPGLLSIGVVGAIAMIRLGDLGWVSELRSNVAAFTASGAGDPGILNPIRYQMVNLHPLVVDLLGQSVPTGLIVWGIVGLFGIAYFLVPRKTQEHPGDLLAITMVSTMGLMLVYHRSYDAIVLLAGLAWALGAWKRQRRLHAALVAMACGVFALPLTGLFATLVGKGVIPASIASSDLWRTGIMGHQSWTLVIVGVLLVWCRGMESSAFATTKSDAKGI